MEHSGIKKDAPHTSYSPNGSTICQRTNKPYEVLLKKGPNAPYYDMFCSICKENLGAVHEKHVNPDNLVEVVEESSEDGAKPL